MESHSADADQTALLNWVLRHGLVEPTAESERPLETHRRALAEAAEAITEPLSAIAMTDGSPENERVFIRGNHRTLGEEVPRRFLTALGGETKYQGSGRLELARQIADPSNPLTSRVIVNRLWHHLFGRGIVASVDNFGVLGQQPTHPELLDYLAVRFVNDGWSIKKMLRSLVLSSTYQMASTPSKAAAEIDPQNLLLHRMRIRRLEGESIRDAILAVSGSLDQTMYGPSVATHITQFMQGRGRPKESGPLDGLGRRSVYLEVRRNFLSPMMLAFDTPIPFSTVGRRNRSNVPAQALILMNDPFVIEQSAKWATRMAGTADTMITQMYLAAFARQPSNTERQDCHRFLERQRKFQTAANAEDSADGSIDERAWADLAHALLNVKEFAFLR
jgi:hypothetical protein